MFQSLNLFLGTAANERPAIQAAIDALADAGGGTLRITTPPNGASIEPATGGYGLLMRNGVYLVGSHPLAARLRFFGAFTDSLIRGASRDDNVPTNYEITGLEKLWLHNESNSAVAVIDRTGWRHSPVRDVLLGNNSPANGAIAILDSDRNPAGNSHKSCFFNPVENVGLHGGKFGTWLKVNQYYGDCNTSFFRGMNAGCRVLFDFTEATNDLGAVIESVYAAGDSYADSWVFKSNVYGSKTFLRSLSYEGFAHLPEGDGEGVGGMAVFGTDHLSAFSPGMYTAQRGHVSFHGWGPALAQELFDGPGVAPGFVGGADNDLAVLQTSSTQVVVKGGIAHNRYRLNALGQNITLAVTNTSADHAEYVVVNQAKRGDITARVKIKIAPDATDLVLAELAVAATGQITGLTDVRPFLKLRASLL